MAKQVWDIDVILKGEKEALNVQARLNQGERDRKAAFERTNAQAKKTRESVAGVNKEISVLNQAGVSLTKTFAVAFATDQIVKASKALADLTLDIDDFNRKLVQNTGLQGKQLDELSAKQRGLAKTFAKDQDELSTRVNQFAKQFEITQSQAFELIKKGFKGNADAEGDFLNKIKEYGVQFKNAGLSADQFIKFAIQEVRGGVFDDKLLDTVRETGLRLRELTPATQEAIKQLGQPFATKLIKDLKQGQISTDQAFLKVLKRSKELNLSVDKTQKIIADLGGGALEDLGGLEMAIKNITAAQNINLDAQSQYTKDLDKRIELDRELAEVQGKLAKELSGVAKGSRLLYQEVQVLVFKGLLEFIKTVKALPEFVEENKEALIALGIAITALNTRLIITKGVLLADAAAKRASTVATTLFTKATNRLKAAVRANPLGLLLAAATALYGVYKLLTKEGNRYAKIQGKIQKAGSEATVAVRKENAEFNTQIDRLKALNPGSDERKQLIEKINKKYKSYLPNLLTEASSLTEIEKAQKKVNKAYKVRVELISKKKQLDIIGDEIAVLEKRNNELDELFMNREPGGALTQLGRLFSEGEGGLQKEVEANLKIIEKLKARSQELLSEIDDINKKSQKTVSKTPEVTTGGVDVSNLKAQQKVIQDRLKAEKQAEFELKKLRTQRLVDISLQAQKEERESEVKKKLIGNEMRLRIRLASLEKMQSLDAAKSESQKLVAQERFAQAKVQIERDAQEKIKQVNLAAIEASQKNIAEQLKIREGLKNAGAFDIEKKEFEEIERLGESYKAGEISYEKYEERKVEINRKFAKERFNLELASLHARLKIQGLGLPKRAEIEQKILALKKSFAEKEVEIEKEKNAKIVEEEKKLKEAKKEFRQKTYEFSKKLVDSFFEGNLERQDREIERLQAQKEFELKLVGDNAQAKAITEQKFADRERQIKQKQVKIQRDQALFQIASDTISSASKTAASLPYPAAVPLILLAIAEGGLRLAALKKIQPPKFFHGDDNVKRLNGEPAGRDTILAYLNEGEGVSPTHINQELLKTGIGVTDPRLPQLVSLGLEYEKVKSQGKKGVSGQQLGVDYNEFGKAVAKNLPPMVVNQITEEGIVRYYQSKGQKTKILNKDNSW